MVRWEPGAADRLREAAIDLFVEQGYDGTTVANIAERAGVTPRTFFRYYADKREVLFAGSSILLEQMTQAAADAPERATPLEAVSAALSAAARLIGDDLGWSQRRYRIITANPELDERELRKMSAIAAALTEALVARGATSDDARLAAEAGVMVFRVGYERWVSGAATGSLDEVLLSTLDQVRALG